MAEKSGAYETTAKDTDFRRKWDKQEYAEKAKKKDDEERERMKDNEERLKKGKRPIKGKKIDLPRPTELMQQREGPLDLDKNLGKTMVVQNPGGRGPDQPGFHCATCNRTYKDTVGYLDHINSRAHLRALGQTTKIERSTLAQVQARIAYLREKTKEAASAKAYDFDKRLEEVRQKERERKAEKKAEREREKEKEKLHAAIQESTEDVEMKMIMGFGGFGTSKK